MNIKSPLKFSVFCSFNSILEGDNTEPRVRVDEVDEAKLGELYGALLVTSSFMDFSRWIHDGGHSLTVVSQGWRSYVERTLARHKINVQVLANLLEGKSRGTAGIVTPREKREFARPSTPLRAAGSLLTPPEDGEPSGSSTPLGAAGSLSTPRKDGEPSGPSIPLGAAGAITTPWEDCECTRCLVCTRNILVTRSSDAEVIVFIGSDFMDVCPAKYSDVVFARGPLETACREENVTYRQFRSFLEIKRQLELLMARGRFKVPERARVRRKELWKHE